jgi:hypothetical protein
MLPVLKSIIWPVLGLFVFSIAGCSTPAATPSRAVTAHIVVVNLSDCVWQIAITAHRDGKARVSRVPAKATLESDLPGGDYGIEQTIVTDNASPGSTRHFELRLEAGQTYRWRLATLQSTPAATPDHPEARP